MEVRIKSKADLLRWALFGVFLFIFGMIFLTLDPVGRIVKYKLTMTEGSMVHGMWSNIPVEMYMKMYVFNITNADDFLSGVAKELEFEEIGPYVFREWRSNNNITFNKNKTLSFFPDTRVQFIPEKSVGDPAVDQIYTVNIPVLGIMSNYAKASVLKKLSLNALVASMQAKLILRLTINDFFWGYEDPLVRVASRYVPNWLDFEKFGIMDRMYAKQHNDTVTMDLNEENDQLYTIQLWNGLAGLKSWNYTDPETSLPCNSLKGVYEGFLFPPNVPKNKSITVYRRMFCRSLRVNYVGSLTTPSGLEGYSYELPLTELSCKNPNNTCYCPKNGPCLPDGLTDISPCYYGLPIASSFPHFYKADPIVMNKIKGLNPDKKKHATRIILQPDIGIPIDLATRTQVSLYLGDLQFNRKAKPFSNMYIPIVWLDGTVEGLPTFLYILILLISNYLPKIQVALGWSFLAISIALMSYQIKTYLRKEKSTQMNKKTAVYYAAVSLTEKDKNNGVRIVR